MGTTDALAQIQLINQSTEPKRTANDDPNRKSWGQFFRMTATPAMTANEAQKKQSSTLRDEQAQEGILKALEMGLGTWTVSVAGRSFVKVEVTSPSLPLFTTNE